MTIPSLRRSAAFSPDVIAEIERAADEGLYKIRGFGTLRPLPSFDDLVLLGASISRYPLEGYRERCATEVTLGTRFAKKPIELKIPITIAGMSFGALGANAKEALGRGATAVGTCTTTGDGGMSEEERSESKILVYQVLPSRYGFDPDDLRAARRSRSSSARARSRAAAACCSGRRLPTGSRRCGPCRPASTSAAPAAIPDWTGPDDLTIKIQELREITDWEKPIFVKIGASRPRYTTCSSPSRPGPTSSCSTACRAAPRATQEVFIEHAGIPTLPALRQAVRRSRSWTCTARCS